MPIRFPYGGKMRTVGEIALRESCDPNTIYRYLKLNNNSLDGFQERRRSRERKTPFFISRAKAPNKKNYVTLDDSIPFDRCLRMSGYSSIKQFCAVHQLSPTQIGCWRNGRLADPKERFGNVSHTLVDEMTNYGRGLSFTICKLMEATGFLEYELFPDVFTAEYYKSVAKRIVRNVHNGTLVSNPTILDNERRSKVEDLLFTLSRRDRLVIELTFGIGRNGVGMTRMEIGRLLGITRQRVLQITERAFKHLRRDLYRTRFRELIP